MIEIDQNPKKGTEHASPNDEGCRVSIPMDSFDRLTAKLSMLEANLVLINGSGLANFHNHSEKIQDAYLWGCLELASECRALASQ